MQALVHAFQSIFTCSRDESPLHPLELVRSEINAQGCPGGSLGGLYLDDSRLGWDRGPLFPLTRLIGSIMGCAHHQVLLLTLLAATHFRLLPSCSGERKRKRSLRMCSVRSECVIRKALLG